VKLIPLDFHCIEAGYTEYDVAQSGGLYSNQSVRVAALMASDTVVYLAGPYDDRGLLCDIDLLVGPRALEFEWPALLDSITADHKHGGRPLDTITSLELRSKAKSLTLWVGERASKALGLNGPMTIHMQNADIAEAGADGLRRRILLGPVLVPDFDTLDARVELLESDELWERFQSDRRPHTATIAMLTQRFRDRRLDGPVAADCPWPTQVAFGKTLQRLEKAGINWAGGEYGDAARAIVSEDLGIELSSQEYFEAVNKTFGNAAAAFDAACALPEVRHMPLVLVNQGNDDERGTRLLGVVWLPTRKDDRNTVLVGMVQRLFVRDLDSDAPLGTLAVSLMSSAGHSDPEDYAVPLRAIPDQEE